MDKEQLMEKPPIRELPTVKQSAKIISITSLLAERQAAEQVDWQAAEQADEQVDWQTDTGAFDRQFDGAFDRSPDRSFDISSYKPFTLKAAIELACPPTWVASITSVMIGGVAAITLNPSTLVTFDLRTIGVWFLMLAIAVLMQSAVNTINDYEDFKTGLDTAETILDQTDASIVYNEIDPKSARSFAIVLLAVSAILGLIVVFLSAWPLLVVGLIAAAVVVLYSVGPKPISYLPIGEIFAGIFLGAFVICSTYYAMTLTFSPVVITITVPSTITIALILQTNNTCDIGRDITANRRTLPILLGLKRSVRVLRVLAWATPIYMVIWVAAFDVIFWRSFVLLFLDIGIAVSLYFLFRARIAYIVIGAYDLINRASMMGNINRFCRSVGLSWAVILLVCWVFGDVLAFL